MAVTRRCGPSAILALAPLFLAGHGLAAPLRVTSWDMRTRPGGSTPATAESQVQDAAAAIKKLDPDVILLHQVRDWPMCAQLAQALKPADYNVLVCTAFREAEAGGAAPSQEAILAKRKAYFAWSEPWRVEGETGSMGGFAFAALQVGKQRLGFFVVQLGPRLAAAAGAGPNSALAWSQSACRRQWEQEVASYRNWATNRPEGVVIAVAFNSASAGPLSGGGTSTQNLKAEGFAAALLGAPLDQPITLPAPGEPPGTDVEHFSARLEAEPGGLSGVILSRCPATCELEVNPANPAGRVPARAAAPAQTRAAPSEPVQLGSVPAGNPQPPPLGFRPGWLAAITGGIVGLVAVVGLLARRRPRFLPATPTLIALNVESSRRAASSETLVITPQSVTGSSSDQALAPSVSGPVIHLEAAEATQTQSGHWQRRALAAEQRAAHAQAVIRTGLIPHLSQWLKGRLVRRLITDRAELLATQRAAALKALAVDERLARIERQLQQQNQAYERRIEALTREVLTAKEENRELIRSKITQVKAEMEAARARMLAQADELRAGSSQKTIESP